MVLLKGPYDSYVTGPRSDKDEVSLMHRRQLHQQPDLPFPWEHNLPGTP
jgi:hypothetical protein